MQILWMNRKVEFKRWWAVTLCILLSGTAVTAGTATNRYVVKNNPTAATPYDTEANAAPDIQTAVDAAVAANGDQVIVAPGTYDTGGMMVPGHSLTSRVMVNKAIVVRSRDNDRVNTIIEGAWDPATNGPAAVRGVYLASGATLAGFTVRNGATLLTSGNKFDLRGGGVFCAAVTDTVISNCVIVNSVGTTWGGGVYFGTILNSLIVSNQVASNGGGVYSSVLDGCTISRNRVGANGNGGGGYSVTASNCVFSHNEAVRGGGIYEGTLYNCLLYGNFTDGPFSGQGGGAAYGGFSLYNCTVVGNRDTWVGGGGLYVNGTAKVWNSIVYSNQAREAFGPNIIIKAGATLYITNSCTSPAISGWADGNIADDPLFIDSGSGYGLEHLVGDYHLSRSSPCIDAGLNQAWMTSADDLDGVERIKDGLVNIGCYESFFPRGTTILIR